MDDLTIDLDEMGTFEGALRYTLALATHWDRLNIPGDTQVMIAGFSFQADEVAQQGTALTMPREANDSQIVIASNNFTDCSVAGAADLLIDLAHDAIRAE